MGKFEANLILRSLEKRWQDYFAQLKACRVEPAPENIHEFRVATRRLFSIVELIRAIQPSPGLRDLRNNLKNQLDELDRLSDTQVMAAEIGKIIPQYPSAKPLLSHLQKREKSLRLKASRQIRSIEERKLSEQKQAIREVQDGGFVITEGLHGALLRVLDDAYATTLRRYRSVDPSQTATIHQLRIAFRKFRYLVEIIYPTLRGYPLENLKSMREYQGSMGVIQDLETFLCFLEDYAKSHKKLNLEPLLRYYRQQHSEAVSSFKVYMNNIRRFWRPSKSARFPWTKRRRRVSVAAGADGSQTGITSEKESILPGIKDV